MRMPACLLATVAAATIASAAHAAPSDATFAYTAGPPGSAVLTLDGVDYTATNRGWIAADGANNGGGAEGNYLAGRCGSSDICAGDDQLRNNYFTFDLGSIDPVRSATLKLAQPLNSYGIAGYNGYLSSASTLTYALYDYLGLGSVTVAGLDGYQDLQSGLSFGDATLSAASNGTLVSIDFNSFGIAALNASLGRTFTLGGTVEGMSAAVPEPATWATMIGGIGIAGGAMRRRRRTVRTPAFA